MSGKIIHLNEYGMYCCTGYDEDSLNLLIYDFLLKIKREPCLKIAFRLCERDYGATYDDIKEVLVENNYIKHDFTKESWIKYGMSLTLDEIKQIASDYDLKTYGRKEDVLIRIYDNVDVNALDVDYYFLTDEGLDFISEHEYIEYYSRVLAFLFKFSHFEKYYLENGQNTDALLSYFKMHEEIARSNGDVRHLAAAFAGYSQTCTYYNIKDGLYEALYEYCLRVNYPRRVMLSDLVDWDNAHTIIELSKLYSTEEFDDMLNDIFKEIGRTKYSKEIIKKSLKELLKTENTDYVVKFLKDN